MKTMFQKKNIEKYQLILLIGAISLILAAFLPWIDVYELYGNVPGVNEGIEIGWEGDGFITGGIGLILILGIITSKGIPRKMYSIAGAIFGVLAISVIIADFFAIVRVAPRAGVLASTDVGLYLTFVGGLCAIIGSILATNYHKSKL